MQHLESVLVDIRPRDGGTVVRLRGPYNTPDVDYWPSTRSVRQVGSNYFPLFRNQNFTFAEHLAFYGTLPRVPMLEYVSYNPTVLKNPRIYLATQRPLDSIKRHKRRKRR